MAAIALAPFILVGYVIYRIIKAASKREKTEQQK